LDFSLLNPEIQKFITKSVNEDLKKMALQRNPFPDVDWSSILNQISCKAKAKVKLPTFYNAENILYPSKTSLEQTSSEKTASYKAGLIQGESLIDLTGGFGVDVVFFSEKFTNILHCEKDVELSDIARNNFKALKLNNVETVCGDGYNIIHSKNQKFDWIYIDPSRRSDTKQKVFMLKDCEPNVPALLTEYFKFSNNILIKTSPILDISAGILELNFVKEIHIVAVDSEVKELVWMVEKNYMGEITIHSTNISKLKTANFIFIYGKKNIEFAFDYPLKYLYEPNASIMKSGGFDEVAAQFCMSKFHQNSHLYTSDKLIDFPGRIFKIVNSFDYSKSNMLLHLKKKKANITTRNFTETVEEIRSKWKIKDGGDMYYFFTTNKDHKKIVVVGIQV
jgi:predicted RNA methylase